MYNYYEYEKIHELRNILSGGRYQLYLLPQYCRDNNLNKKNLITSLLIYYKNKWLIKFNINICNIKEVLELIFTNNDIVTYKLGDLISCLNPNLLPIMSIYNIEDIYISQRCFSKPIFVNKNLSSELERCYGKKINEYCDSDFITSLSLKYKDTNFKTISEIIFFSYFSTKIKLRIQDYGLITLNTLEQKVNVILSLNKYNGFKIDKRRVFSKKASIKHEKIQIIEKISKDLKSKYPLSQDISTNQILQIINTEFLSRKIITNPMYFSNLNIYTKHKSVKLLNNLIRLEKEERMLSKLLRKIDNSTGRLISQLNQFGTETGRIVSSNFNYQSIPKRQSYRRMFVPDKNNKFIVADFSQSELVIAAHLSQDEKLIKALKRNIDLHKLTASIILKKTIGSITKEERNIGKNCNFGILYGMGSKSLQDLLSKRCNRKVTISESQSYINNFLSNYSGFSQWRNLIPSYGHHTSITQLKRKRYFYDESPTKRWNTPIQSTGSDLLKQSISLLHPMLKKINSWIVAVVHDEIIIEVPIENVISAKEILEKCMIDAGKLIIKSVPIKIDCDIRDDWWS